MFSMILLAFAGIALVVATFSIHNTFSILVAQRTRESALLRAIGASRRQVITAVGVEALVIGIDRLGHRLRGRHRAGHRARRPDGRRRPRPALRRARHQHRHDRRRRASSASSRRSSPASPRRSRRLASPRWRPCATSPSTAPVRRRCGRSRVVVIAAAGALAVVTATSSPDGAMARAGLGALAMLVGFVVLGPVVARPSAAVLGAGASATRGFTGRLARRNAMRNPRRIAGSAAALMVGTAVVALFTTFGSSIKASIERHGRRQLRRRPDRRPDGLQRRRHRPRRGAGDRRAARGRRLGRVVAGDRPRSATTPSSRWRPTRPPSPRSSTSTTARATSPTSGRGEIAVSSRCADDHDVALGDVLPLTFVDGTTTDLTVAATSSSDRTSWAT